MNLGISDTGRPVKGPTGQQLTRRSAQCRRTPGFPRQHDHQNSEQAPRTSRCGPFALGRMPHLAGEWASKALDVKKRSQAILPHRSTNEFLQKDLPSSYRSQVYANSRAACRSVDGLHSLRRPVSCPPHACTRESRAGRQKERAARFFPSVAASVPILNSRSPATPDHLTGTPARFAAGPVLGNAAKRHNQEYRTG